MRFVLNTHVENMGSQVCIHDLQARLSDAGFEASLNDFDDYSRYDVAVFMAVDHEMEKARRQNSDIKIVLGDPKQSSRSVAEAARKADLLLVSSVEQRESFLRFNRNILIHYMFPTMRAIDRSHSDRDPLVIGYHGNKVHLEAMCQHVTPALNALGRARSCRFLAMYNVAGLGKASVGLPDPALIPTEHVQWSWDSYFSKLATVDIGIAPNLLPIAEKVDTLRTAEVAGLNVNYEPFDFLTRFKGSSNPGRLYVFARLGIPVVADFTPSSVEVVQDGESGFLAGSPVGWFEALSRLAEDPDLRQRCAENLRKRVDALYDAQIAKFVDACQARPKGQPVDFGDSSFETELAAYVSPAVPSASLFRRLGRRLGIGDIAR